MTGARKVGELWCTEVLAALGDYVDDALTPAQRSAVEVHLAGCDWCAQFGGRYAALVARLQRRLGELPIRLSKRSTL